MHYDPTNPLIVQGDRTLLMEVQSPRFAEAREAIAPFAELEKSPEYIHTYGVYRRRHRGWRVLSQ